MGDFHREYYGQWSESRNREAELLWLYYDYMTEMYDQFLPHVPDRHEEDVVMVRPDYRHLSNKYAENLRRFIYGVASYQGIPEEDMERERMDRLKFKMGPRFKEYEHVREYMPEKLAFIQEYLEYKEWQLRMMGR